LRLPRLAHQPDCDFSALNYPSAMNTLVTGATGFIGSHLAEMLKEQGHEVRLLVRSEKRLIPELQQGYEVIKGDVTQSPEELRPAMEGVDTVFHLAGLLFGRTEREFNAANARGTSNLCEAAKLAGVKRFLFSSSLAAVGPCEDSRHIVDEESVPHPVTFYGRSKLLAEKIVREYGEHFPATIIRPPAVYGPRDKGILEFFKWMSKGYSLRFGSQESVLSLIHGKDVARAMIEAAQHEATIGQTYFVTDPEPYPLSWTMELLRETLKPSRNRTLSAPVWTAMLFARVNDVLQIILRKPMLPNSDKIQELVKPYWICSGEKARRDFGFEPKIDIRTGLKETADWYIEKGWIKVR
jgi:nucleoside-diphosphate-sugar epimerase